VDQSDPYQVTAVDVTARLDGVTNGPVPAFMSKVLGRQDFDVTSRSTAYLGFAGNFGPGEIDLPVAIDCCKLRGSDCEQDYCATVASPPNPCALDDPQTTGPNTVSCLQFHNTAEQNACWTQFDGDSSSINTADLRDIVEDGSAVEISVPWPAYVDNGDKTPVIGEIDDRFMGQGGYVGNGEGIDFYADSGGSTPDSWVVRLPVINCQTADHCAGGTPATIIGAVCFEIREIVVTPDKIIRGTFMCPGHPRWSDCDIDGTGGQLLVKAIACVDDDVLGAEAAQVLAMAFVARDCRDCRTEPGRHLNGRAAHTAVGSGDQNLLTRFDGAKAGKPAIGSAKGAVKHGGFGGWNVVGHRIEAALRGKQVACVATVEHEAKDPRCSLAKRSAFPLAGRALTAKVTVCGRDTIPDGPVCDVRADRKDPAHGFVTRGDGSLNELEPSGSVDAIPEAHTTGFDFDQYLVSRGVGQGCIAGLDGEVHVPANLGQACAFGHGHCPLKFGFRPSRNAAIPSLASFDRMFRRKTRASSSMPRAKPSRRPTFTALLMLAIAPVA